MIRDGTSNVVAVLVTMLVISCDGPGKTDHPQQPPPTIRSKNAPYRIQLPEPWRRLAPEEVNERADVAATVRGDLFLIVIPQKLPTAKGVRSIGAETLKRAGIRQMDERVRAFELEHEGPVQLDGRPGLSVFAEGQIGGEPIQFAATYVANDGWGYQIIAWGPGRDESALAKHVQPVLDTWQFRESVGPTTARSADAGAGDTAGEQTDR
ncbi:MAG: hypothetical protein ABEL76_14125 [Bradymonadaceae bacterium]